MTGFGKELLASAHAPWIEHYLRYKLLKKLIKLIHTCETEGHVQIEADGGYPGGVLNALFRTQMGQCW